ncbi:hypothetical protein [Actinopolymorpha rutila]|uniref:Uncharacterized protein n=1 Tax=Actinopolymorpha rutila TaxID=446787 RepID=A0A852ZCJ3_9ACTN|nr:hypothetical protein [Actinopolymorpha rutila]NYH90831.1 hypothetical protein [Actinopolymorpha rutila]
MEGSTDPLPADALPADLPTDLLPAYVLPALVERGLVPPGTPVGWSDSGPGQVALEGADRARVRVGGPAGHRGATAARRGEVVEVRIDRVEIVPPTPAAKPEPGPALPAVDHAAYRARRREGRR